MKRNPPSEETKVISRCFPLLWEKCICCKKEFRFELGFEKCIDILGRKYQYASICKTCGKDKKTAAIIFKDRIKDYKGTPPRPSAPANIERPSNH